MPPRIYLDANATTPVLPEVVAAMQPFWADRFGNASAVHAHGRSARAAIDDARDHLAALLNARAAEITFTAGGTESNNHALFGLLAPGQHLITTAIEHHAVLHPAEELQRRGIEVTIVDPDQNGQVPVDKIREAFRPNTVLVSLMLANNETGVLQHVRAVAILAHARGALLHTDAVQACGKLPIDVRELGCDLLSLSAHKMHAPQGVGALWTRRGLPLRPLLHGGAHERQRRAGTENVPGIVALGEAARQTALWIEHDGPAKLTKLHRNFEADLLRRISNTTIHGTGIADPAKPSHPQQTTTYDSPPAEAVPRLPNTTCVSFAGVDAEALVIALDLKGLSISGGSACTSGAVEPSHVLTAMGLPEAAARSTVRLSLSRQTTPAELTTTLHLLESTITHLRSIT